MTLTPSIVKGHNLLGEAATTTHLVVVADDSHESAVLAIASEWVCAGVMEPAVWIPANWLATDDARLSEPFGVVFGRGATPEQRRVAVLEVLAREPHTDIIVTVINPVTSGTEKDQLSSRINGLVRALAASRPQERTIDHRPVKGTEIRVINLIFPPGDAIVPGIAHHLLRSDLAEVENFVVNPEDRPTPSSFDVVPRADSPRWPSYLVSSTATISGLWSSLATSPVAPDAAWVLGNVRLVRSFARVVLTHPLLVQVADSTRSTLLSEQCPVSIPGILLNPPQLATLGQATLTIRLDEYAEWAMQYSGLGYRELAPFEPPSRIPRGFFASLGDFMNFTGDRLAALPRWIWEAAIARFNKRATQKLYGDDSLVQVDVRVDLNRGTDDPRLVEAWELVAQERARLESILAAPTEPPEESDDPRPWLVLHEGVAFFAEGTRNEIHDALKSEDGTPLVASNLDDVIPPPDDKFTVDDTCDEILGGDGTGRQVTWIDVDGANRLRSLMQRVATAKRRRVGELREAYLATERDFFASQERFLQARFKHKDLAAQESRELRIAAADGVSPDAGLTTGASRLLQAHVLRNETGAAQAKDSSDGDPFASPLDDIVATPKDLVKLRDRAAQAQAIAARERRLRGAMNEVAADELDRIHEAESDLKVVERTHGELARWIERRSASFIGRILSKVDLTSQQLDQREKLVLESAENAIPDYGPASVELQRRFVRSVVLGIGITLLAALIVTLANRWLESSGAIPSFTGLPWWSIATAFVIALLLVVFTPLVTYFQAWTRERIRADDARAQLQYQCTLVAHVRTERLRLAQLYTQLPQRIRALSHWWHYWRQEDQANYGRHATQLPSGENLPWHLRWAVATWSQSQVFRRLQDGLLTSYVRPGYRSTLIQEAIDKFENTSGRSGMLDPEKLARLRSSDALTVVQEWVNDDQVRQSAQSGLERRIARSAQDLHREPSQTAPHVDILNPDPLAGLDIETDLVGESGARLVSTDDFLLEIAGDSAEMGYRLWAPGVGVQPFTSYFAGPDRLSKRLPASVSFVHAETTKMCSSEVSVRLDITGQVSVDKLDQAYAEPVEEIAEDDEGLD